MHISGKSVAISILIQSILKKTFHGIYHHFPVIDIGLQHHIGNGGDKIFLITVFDVIYVISSRGAYLRKLASFPQAKELADNLDAIDKRLKAIEG